MKIALVMVSSDGSSRPLPEMSLPISIGRGDDCKLRIPLAAVSRHHCELFDDDDELSVKDLGSSNGTYVNKERVKTRELVPGDLLSVGGVVFVVRIDGHPKVVDPVISYHNGAVSLDDVRSGGAVDAGVPTWTGKPARGPSTPSGPAQRGAGGKPAARSSPGAPAGPGAAAKDAGFENLLADLSESDFDIELPDDDDGPGSKPPAGAKPKK
jgi:predicted component of type VI protein secretion system